MDEAGDAFGGTARAGPRRRGRWLAGALLVCAALSLSPPTGSQGLARGPVEWLTGQLELAAQGGSIPTVDARGLPDGAVVDLTTLAEALGAATRDPHAVERVQVVEVLDPGVLRIASNRGLHTVAVTGVGGRHGLLPEPVDRWLRDVAVPALTAWLCDPRTEVFEMLSPPGGVWPLHDRFGRRCVRLLVRGPDGGMPDMLGERIFREGWGWPAHPFYDALAAAGPALLFARSDDDAGLRGLPALDAVRRTVRATQRRLAALDDEALTARARAIQDELAAMLGWQPEQRVRVRWGSLREARAYFAAQHARKARPDDEAAPAERREQIDALVQRVAAWSPPGPEIVLLPSASAVGHDDLFDGLLAHEIAHHYQEEVLYRGAEYPTREWAPLEGQAELIAARWLQRRMPAHVECAGFTYVDETHDLVQLMELLGADDVEVVRRFQDGRLAPLSWWLARQGWGYPAVGWPRRLHPAPELELVPPPGSGRSSERSYVLITNRTSSELRGRLGSWSFSLPVTARAAEGNARGLDTFPLDSSLLDLILPAGRSVTVALPSAFGSGSNRGIHARWSPTADESP